MKTGAIFLKALVIGGVAFSVANFSHEAQAATPLTTQNKAALDVRTGSILASSITSMLAAAPAADREQLAKDIVAYLGAKPGVSRDVLKTAVKAAVAQVPGKAAGIALAAAQAAVAGNSANQGDLVKAIIEGAKAGAPGEVAAIQAALIGALPLLETIIKEAIAATPDAPVQPGVNNVTDSSTSSKS